MTPKLLPYSPELKTFLIDQGVPDDHYREHGVRLVGAHVEVDVIQRDQDGEIWITRDGELVTREYRIDLITGQLEVARHADRHSLA